MKIGIITYWNSNDNYGQVLQCYALQQYLINQGHDTFLIRYLPHNSSRPFLQKLKENLSWGKVVYFLSSQRRIDKQNQAKEKDLEIVNRKLNTKRKFDSFKAKYIRSTNIVYHSIIELRNNPPLADVYVCGSDQVWNNKLTLPETAAWYLDFGDKKTKRISYAASIGRALQKNEINIFKKNLMAFDAISVREESTYLLCKYIGVPNVRVTLDPTLLLPVDEYRKIEPLASVPSAPYMFMYILNVSTKDEIYWKDIQNYLAMKNLDLKIVCSSGYLQARELLDSHHNIQATLPEWLQYIDQAECVVTTSFHGVVFCIKMHKPFLAILLTNKYAKGNDRITSLLKSLDLSNRIYSPSSSIGKQISKKIDWIKIEEKISSLKEDSCDFLKNI